MFIIYLLYVFKYVIINMLLLRRYYFVTLCKRLFTERLRNYTHVVGDCEFSCWVSEQTVRESTLLSGSARLAALLMADIQLDLMPAVTADSTVLPLSSQACIVRQSG